MRIDLKTTIQPVEFMYGRWKSSFQGFSKSSYRFVVFEQMYTSPVRRSFATVGEFSANLKNFCKLQRVYTLENFYEPQEYFYQKCFTTKFDGVLQTSKNF